MGKPRPPLPPGPYLVVGLARSGVAAALALRARGEEVIGVDAGGPERPALARAAGRLRDAGVEVHLDASGVDFAARAGTLIKSPGVPQDAPAIRAARARGAVVLGELELAWRLLPNEFVAVTGTNGKTTTTEWIGHIHREAGLPVAVAGNVGTAASSLVDRLAPDVTIVCEASSFQLEDTIAFAPEVAVLLNLSPDHLDRHRATRTTSPPSCGSSPTRATTTSPWRRPTSGSRTSAGAPGACCSARAAARAVRPRRLPVVGRAAARPRRRDRAPGRAQPPERDGRRRRVPGARGRRRRGRGRPADVRRRRHRLELVAVKDGVAYVNDSKATNVASTIVALRAFAGGVHLIAGGRGKHQDFSPLAPLVAERCRAVYLIGEAAGELADALAETGVPLRQAGDLERAVALADAAARAGEIVLLSPACASYDQYPDFEARGDHFRALVERA